MNIYTLFKIIFIVGYYLGGAECSTMAELYKDAVKKYYSGKGAPATVFKVEDYVSQNTNCFVALLRNIQMKLEASPTPIKDFSEYGHYFNTVYHLLNSDIYFMVFEDLTTVYVEMLLKDRSEEKDNVLIRSKIFEIIRQVTEKKTWYSEKGIVGPNSADNKFFQKCSTIYNNFKTMNEKFNTTLSTAVRVVDDRLGLIRSLPFLVSEYITDLYNNRSRNDVQINTDLKAVLDPIATFYGEYTVKMIKDSTTVLVCAYKKDKGTKDSWFIENNEYLKNHIVLTRGIVERTEMIMQKYSQLLLYYNSNEKSQEIQKKPLTVQEEREIRYNYRRYKYETKPAQPEVFKNYVKGRQSYFSTLSKILEGLNIENENSYSMDKVSKEYPDMMGYYPKRDFIDIPDSDKTTTTLLNIQALVTVFPLHLEFSIFAIEEITRQRPKVPEEAVQLPHPTEKPFEDVTIPNKANPQNPSPPGATIPNKANPQNPSPPGATIPSIANPESPSPPGATITNQA